MTKTGLGLLLAAASVLSIPPEVHAQATASGAVRGTRPQPAPTGQQPRASSRTDLQRLAPQGFSVVLVLGDLQGGSVQDTVPAAARKALTDMKDFLPYKGYRLLDVQWTLCCGRGSSTPTVSRLRGADGQEYELTLMTDIDSRNRLAVRFQLRDPSTTTVRGDALPETVVQLEREAVRLEEQLDRARKTAQQRFEVGTGGPVNEDRNLQDLQARLADIKIRLAEARDRRVSQSRSKMSGNRAVIDTSFTMDIGETVVVGTSRIAGGDKALIALLTAVAQK